MKSFLNMLKNKSGAAMAEYAVLLAVVTLVAAASFVTLGGNINNRVGAAATAVGTTAP